MRKRQQIAERFLSEWFEPQDTFALLVRHPETSRTLQRIVRLPDLMKSNYLGWLAFENTRGANIYFSINPLSFGAKKRTKSAVAAVKGLYLDLDSDGDLKLANLRESNNVPPPSVVIRTSRDKYQVIWRVQGFTIPEQEAMLKGLAQKFGGDRACTDCARVFRLPGFFNRKYVPAFPVVSEMHAIQCVYSPSDFRLELPTHTAVQPTTVSQPRPLRSQTRSESDWRWVMAQLDAGIPTQEVVQTLANIRSDKPSPLYYAHRTVDIASAVRWVRRGVDVESVIETLKQHDSALSIERVAEIATTAYRFVQRTRIQRAKENQHATARNHSNPSNQRLGPA
ncbi:DNA-primase RepB domain-containing protein [Edaphobacter sp.]|uniref:DNA-primase RepB domain-containing protein n=1 Tax=Edaphobacter sp. TaxID=1934404 RepID=UPI002D80A343|nr:DNA-primase RepB domain-containing protein [Edaphobacter sp.]